jgi:two-component system, cell cycle sensor histidine kinase and response regulator CckA
VLAVVGADLGRDGRDATARRRWTRAWPIRYGAALMIVALVLGLKVSFFDLLARPYSFQLLFATAAVAAWAGGLGPGLVAVAVAAVAVDWFWLVPGFRAGLPPREVGRLISFAAEGAAVAFACTRLSDALARPTPADSGTPADRLQRLLAAVRDHAVFQLDAAGRVLTWNAGAERILACPEADAIGRPFADFAVPEDRAVGGPVTELREAADTGRSERTGWRQRADGTRVWAETVITLTEPTDSDPGNSGYAVVIRDVTARRQAEEVARETDEKLRQAQRLEAVGRLAGGIAHDFNNLLTIILGNLDLILDHDTSADLTRGLLDDVRDAGRRAAVLTRQLLTFSRRQTVAPRRVDVNVVVTEMGSLLRRTIGDHITLVTDLRPEIGPVLADPGHLEQVILNLAVNARDAMPQGGTLAIRTSEVDLPAAELPADAEGPPGRYVALTVADTGVGMDEATKARIFEPFFTTKEIGKGTGLGLATVYGNVKQARGWVAVDSRPGAGATFRVFLPRAEGAADAAVVPPPAQERPRGSETVLLVEDEPALRDLTRRILESAGYTVLTCSDGKAAVEASHHFSGKIDLLVTDLVMPVVNGRQLAETLKAERRRLRVLFMSGYTDSTLAKLGGLMADEDLLDKPFVPDELARKVRQMLDRK